MEIRFQVNAKTFQDEISTEEWEAMEMAQDGQPRIYRLRPILARYVVGEDGKIMSQEGGLKVMAKIPLGEFLRDVFPAFFETLNGIAVPKATGTPSPLPLPVSSAVASPDGSQP